MGDVPDGPTRVDQVIGFGTEYGVHAARDHVDFGQGTFHGTVIGVQNTYGPEPTGSTPTPTPTLIPATADGWPDFRDFRRLALGVRPAHLSGEEPDLPPYVARDCDAELDGLLASALATGGLIVVTGEPLSGKTSTAWAVLNRAVGKDIRVYQAHPGADLRALPDTLSGRDPDRVYVVWLDDLEDHLGENGLTAALLARLSHPRVVVLATMRDEAYDAHRFGDPPTARLLSVARTVEVSCHWSEAELSRLAKPGEPWLMDALDRRGDLGVTQFLALGPELWEEWRRTRRPGRRTRGYQLVRAAVDAARCGIRQALTTQDWQLLLLDGEYGSLRLDEEALREELSWAARPRLGVAGLLVPEEQEEGVAWRASDALVAAASRSSELPPLPPYLWRNMIALAQRVGPAVLDAVVATGRTALRPRTDADDADADVGKVLADLADLAGDEADGDYWRGWYFCVVGPDEKAIHYMERAANAGHVEARMEAAALHVLRAEHWLTQAAEAGDSNAAASLAALRKAFTNPDTVKE